MSAVRYICSERCRNVYTLFLTGAGGAQPLRYLALTSQTNRMGLVWLISLRPPVLRLTMPEECQPQCRSRNLFILMQDLICPPHLRRGRIEKRQMKSPERQARVTVDGEETYEQRLAAPKKSEKDLPEASYH